LPLLGEIVNVDFHFVNLRLNTAQFVSHSRGTSSIKWISLFDYWRLHEIQADVFWKHLRLLPILLCVMIFPSPCYLLAQTQPATFYTFSNMIAGNILTASDYYEEYDFGISFSSMTGFPNKIRVSLVAQDSSGQYNPSYTYKTNDLGTTYHGTYYYLTPTPGACDPDPTVICLNPGQHVTYNVVNASVIVGEPNWTGSVQVESINDNPFYIFPPNQFTAYGTSSLTACDAHYNAWQVNGGPWYPPFFWDSGTHALISPYGNFYRNWQPWDNGWSSVISIANNSTSAVTYTFNFVQSYDQYEAGCDVTELGSNNRVYTYPDPVSPGSTLTLAITDMFPDLLDYGNRATEGTILIQPSVIAPGNDPVHVVLGNSPGAPGMSSCSIRCPGWP
jgi:hypothetical protein